MLSPRILLPILAVALGLVAVALLTAAHAQSAGGEVVPLDDAPSKLVQLWRDGQIIPAVIGGLFVALTYASNHIAWLREGYRGIVLAAVLSSFGLVAAQAIAGTTPNLSMIVGAVVGTVLALMNAKAPAQVAAGTPVSKAIVSGEIKLPPKDGAS